MPPHTGRRLVAIFLHILASYRERALVEPAEMLEDECDQKPILL
jgi:hypothetical protein